MDGQWPPTQVQPTYVYGRLFRDAHKEGAGQFAVASGLGMSQGNRSPLRAKMTILAAREPREVRTEQQACGVRAAGVLVGSQDNGAVRLDVR
jgi:hypothetical protein